MVPHFELVGGGTFDKLDPPNHEKSWDTILTIDKEINFIQQKHSF